MIYTNKDRTQLPTIDKVVEIAREIAQRLPVQHLMPYDRPVVGEDLYILNMTSAGYFTLKPNITTQPCLYAGIAGPAENMRPTWNGVVSEDRHFQNLLREEFNVVMLSHPLYRFLYNGVKTEGGIVQINNPLGNAFAYDFPMPYIPLTSCLETAVFYATHQRNDNGEWEMVPERDEEGNPNIGVLYVYGLPVKFPLILGLSCVGRQVFERPGLHKLFALQLPEGVDFNRHPYTSGFTFRQGAPDGIEPQENMAVTLYPEELIADKANRIRSGHQVSRVAFENYCNRIHANDSDQIRRQVEARGMEIVENSVLTFNDEELRTTYYNRSIEIWNSIFDENVIALHPGFSDMLEDLRRVPEKSEYRNVFEP